MSAMKSIKQVVLYVVLCLLFVNCSVVFASNKNVSAASEDDQLIRAQATNYAKAFAAGDAQTIASMFASDGSFTDSDGQKISGRNNIQEFYTEFFRSHGGQPLEISVASLRFPTSNVAIEEGTARLLNAERPSASRYTALHVKQDGKWQIYSVTDTNVFEANTDSIKDLNWMIGKWVAHGPKASVQVNIEHMGDNFIACKFVPEITGSLAAFQLIGWDPVAQQITSWFFAANGGYGRLYWVKDGQNWVLSANSVQSDGSLGRATYVMHKVDNNGFTWQSTKRSIDGRPLPDTLPIVANREQAAN
jgi:uncharacterized protein (TIGR02246 family)